MLDLWADIYFKQARTYISAVSQGKKLEVHWHAQLDCTMQGFHWYQTDS